MSYAELDEQRTIEMDGLVSFLERWRPGCSKTFVPASIAQIERLAETIGGVGRLPGVYRAFLELAGESLGDLRFVRGTTSVSALLEALEVEPPTASDSGGYLRFSVGEETIELRQPDDFFDLSSPTADGRDAAIFRVDVRKLGEKAARNAPFPTFSDLLRSVLVSKVALRLEDDPIYVNLGDDPRGPARAFDFLAKLGFGLTELSASKRVVPLEDPKRKAIALISGPSPVVPRTRVYVRAVDERQHLLLNELIKDNESALRAP